MIAPAGILLNPLIKLSPAVVNVKNPPSAPAVVPVPLVVPVAPLNVIVVGLPVRVINVGEFVGTESTPNVPLACPANHKSPTAEMVMLVIVSAYADDAMQIRPIS